MQSNEASHLGGCISALVACAVLPSSFGGEREGPTIDATAGALGSEAGQRVAAMCLVVVTMALLVYRATSQHPPSLALFKKCCGRGAR